MMRQDESPLFFISRTDVAPSSAFLTMLKLQTLSSFKPAGSRSVCVLTVRSVSANQTMPPRLNEKHF